MKSPSFYDVQDVLLGDSIRRSVPQDGIEDLSLSPLSLGPIDEVSNKEFFSPKEFTLKKRLGRGEFAEVYLAESSKDGKLMVFKRISKSSSNFSREYIRREKLVGEILDHEGIVQCITMFETANNVYLVFPYFEGKDMITYLEDRNFWPLDDRHAKFLFKQLALSIEHCHRKRVAHRDIKLENILIGNKGMRVKFIDFGLCTIENSNMTTERVGSIDYVAPELILEKIYDALKADIFSLAVVLFCFLFGKFPFIAEERVDEMKRGIIKTVSFDTKDKLFSSVCEEAKDLITSMMNPDPQKRPTIQEVLNHKWLCQK